MEHRRLVGIIIAIGLLIVPGYGVIDTMTDNCVVLSQIQCYILGLAAIASVLGGVLLIELLIAYQKAKGKWRAVEESAKDDEPILSNRQIWFRSIARVLLAAILLSFPIVVQGAFLITVFGVISGFALDFLVRGIMNWMPPVEGGQ